MTSVILVFEVTRDYAIIVPLMIANLVSFFVSRQIHPETLYQSLGRQDGIHFPSEETRTHEKASRQVSHAVRRPEEVLLSNMTVETAADFAAQSRYSSWPIMNDQSIIGVISAKNASLPDREGQRDQKAQRGTQFARFRTCPYEPFLIPALARMGAAGLDLLPVVSRIDIHELVGVIYLADILRSTVFRFKVIGLIILRMFHGKIVLMSAVHRHVKVRG